MSDGGRRRGGDPGNRVRPWVTRPPPAVPGAPLPPEGDHPPAGPPPSPYDPWTPAPPAGDGGRRRLVIAGVALVAVVVGVVGAIWLLGSDGDAERQGGEIVAGGDLSAFAVREGDCWNDPPLDQEVDSLVAVPCAEPHDAEVYAVYDLELDEYPGDAEIGALAEAGCVERFTEFAGIDYATSGLEIVYLNPTQESWDDRDDRTAVCSVSDAAAPITGSLRGAAR